MSETMKAEAAKMISREIAEELRQLAQKLLDKAEELVLEGDYEKSTTAYFLAGYLKAAAEMWMQEK